jgi:hypothetical protein
VVSSEEHGHQAITDNQALTLRGEWSTPSLTANDRRRPAANGKPAAKRQKNGEHSRIILRESLPSCQIDRWNPPTSLPGVLMRSTIVAFVTLAILSLEPTFCRAQTPIRATLHGSVIETMDFVSDPKEAVLRSTQVSIGAEGVKRQKSYPLGFQLSLDHRERFPAMVASDSDYGWVLCPSQSWRMQLVGGRIPDVPVFELIRCDRKDFREIDKRDPKEAGARGFFPDPRPFDYGPLATARKLDNAGDKLSDTGAIFDRVSETTGNFSQQWLRYCTKTDAPSGIGKMVAAALVPLSDRRVRLYAVSEPCPKSMPLWPADDRRTLAIFEYDFAPVRNPNSAIGTPPIVWQGVWTRHALVESPFVAPLEVVRRPECDYLVADGRLYRLAKENPGGELKLTWIPLRDGALVQLLIDDADRKGAAFAFTTDYWFELKEPLEYHEFALAPPKSGDPLPTLARAARELRKLFPAVP